ncbi:MAG TPA: Rrf2 family transcriptional regulator [Nitrospirae bacterium]|nr:Rrf2 family transcriptional regulator [Nitrospirota bacterium]
MSVQITREADYAIRCILHLVGLDGGMSTVRNIADRESIPRSFAAKIVQKLTKAGLVESVRGVKGGFRITRSPEEISLLDVIEAVEGPISMNICVLDKKSCDRQPQCPVHPCWVEITESIRERLGSYTFERILRESGR